MGYFRNGVWLHLANAMVILSPRKARTKEKYVHYHSMASKLAV